MDVLRSFALALCLVVSLVMPTNGQDEQQVHLRFQKTDEIPTGTVICTIPDDAHLMDKYNSNVLFRLRYELIKGDHKEYFQVDPLRGTLSVTSLLDRDVICSQQLECDLVLDIAVVQPVNYFQVIKVTLTLTDANDNDPVFPEKVKTLPLSENAAPPVTFVLPSAVDPDSGVNGIQSYEIVTGTPAFALQTSDDGTGISDIRLELRERLNREEQDSYEVFIIAKDGGQPQRSGTMTVHIQVMDANDNSPTFEFSLYNVSLRENFPLDVPFIRVTATDPDEGPNGKILYSISPQMPSELDKDYFTIDNNSGEISLLAPLDYEKQTTYHLLVAAQDLGPDSVPVHAKVIVHVQDVNDFAPEININSWTSTGQVEVSEDAEPGTFVAHVAVDDKDLGPSGHVTCRTMDDRFALQIMYTNTYKLVTAAVLDREEEDVLTITLECEDQGEEPLSSTKEVTVHVTDINDHEPVFSQTIYTASVPEMSEQGFSILTVKASDHDTGPNAHINYHLHANSKNMIRIDVETGVITAYSLLDHENEEHLEFYVLAIDSGNPAYSATATVFLEITDINDEAPIFPQTSYNFAVYENKPSGTSIGHVTAKDNDSPPNDQFLFSLEKNNGFRINTNSGVITTKKVLDREHQEAYYLLVTATDTEPPYLSGTATVTIYLTDDNDNAPRIDFPTQNNKTVEVSAFAPEGYIITHVLAQDADHSNNARLNYSIAKGNEDKLFNISPNEGIISVSKDLTATSKDTYSLLIMVQDCGEKVKSAVATLVIAINHTQAFADLLELSGSKVATSPVGTAESATGRFSSQDLILIILGAITVVLVSILITAIVCIKKKQRYRDRDSYKYMCRIDLANHISSIQENSRQAVECPAEDSRRDSQCSAEEEEEHDLEKGEFIRFDPRDSGIPAPSLSGSYSDVSNGSNVALQISLGNGGKPVDLEKHTGCAPETPIPTITQSQAPVWTPVRPVQVQHVLNLMPGEHDSDTTSGCSAEMSTSDSSGKSHNDGSLGRKNHIHNIRDTNSLKSCPKHGKNVTFGDVTCHSPTRSRDYSTCPLPQCGATHAYQPHRGDRCDNRTGCHGNNTLNNSNIKPVPCPNPPNGRIHPQPPLVMTTFGYDETARLRQHNRDHSNSSQREDPESKALIHKSSFTQSVDV